MSSITLGGIIKDADGTEIPLQVVLEEHGGNLVTVRNAGLPQDLFDALTEAVAKWQHVNSWDEDGPNWFRVLLYSDSVALFSAMLEKGLNWLSSQAQNHVDELHESY